MPTNLSIQTIMGDVIGSTDHRYAMKDSAGNTMDTVKIIANPAGGNVVVGPLSWTPQFAGESLLVGVSATGDRTNLETVTAGPLLTERLSGSTRSASSRRSAASTRRRAIDAARSCASAEWGKMWVSIKS
jgi:hypothetical protein